MTIRRRTLARECVLQMLYGQEISTVTLEDLLANHWKFQPETEREIKEFAEKLVRGTVEHLQDIDQTIAQYADNWQLGRMAVIDRNIMRFAVYELLYMPDIPPKVTINEAVNIAKKFSQEESGKFVNGVLDKINHTEKPRNTLPHVPPSR